MIISGKANPALAEEQRACECRRDRGDGRLRRLGLDGLGFSHEGGRVFWGRTSLVHPDDGETIIWGDTVEHAPAKLAKTSVRVPGLTKGTKVRVLFEDRGLVAEDGFFVDDFRGHDLYQRFGGGYGVGYGSGPVALHLYELDGP